MARISEEDLRLNILINGDPARKELFNVRNSISGLTDKVNQQQSALKELARTQGKNSAAYKALNKSLNDNRKALAAAQSRYAELSQNMKISDMTISELRNKIKQLNTVISKMDPASEQWAKYKKDLDEAKDRLKALIGVTIQTKTALEKFNTLGFAIGNILDQYTRLLKPVNQAVDAYREYDEVLTDAMKTTNLSREEIESVSETLKKVDTRTAQNELMSLVRIGGKLGITGQEDLIGFAKAADKINVALAEDLGGNAEAAIAAIGKMVDIFQLKDQFGLEKSILMVGSAINELGMASTANEGYMVDFTKRLAGIAPNANISIDKILGLAATLDKYGQTAEMSSTAIGQTIMAMFKRTETFANIAGMSLKDFTDILNTDVNEAFIRVLEGMKGSDGSLASIVASMNDMHLDGQRAAQVLGTLSKNTDELRSQQELANKSFHDGTSIIEEFNTKNESLTAQLEKHKKAIKEQIVTIGQQLLPISKTAMSISDIGIRVLSKLITLTMQYKAIVKAISVAIALYIGVQKMTVFWSKANRQAIAAELLQTKKITAGTMLLASAKNLLAGNIKTAATAMKLFGRALMSNPVGLALGAITTLIGIMSHFASKARDAKKAQKEFNDSVSDTSKAPIALIEELSWKYKKLGDDMAAKEQFIKDNASAFNELGAAVSSVADAENLLVTNKQAFINAQIAKAKAAAYSKLAAGKSEELIKAEEELAAVPKGYVEKKGTYIDGYGQEREGIVQVKDSKWKKAEDKVARLRTEMEGYFAKAKELGEQANTVLAGAKVTPADTTADLKPIIQQPLSTEPPGSDNKLKLFDYVRKTTADELAEEEKLWQQYREKYKGNKDELERIDQEHGTRVQEIKAKAYQETQDYLGKTTADELKEEDEKYRKLKEQNAGNNEVLEKLAQEHQGRINEIREKAMKDADSYIRKDTKAELDAEEERYGKLRQQYAGQTEILDALERTHKARMASIRLKDIDEEQAEAKRQYDIAKAAMENRHDMEVASFKGSADELEQLKKKHVGELASLDLEYAGKLQSILAKVVDINKAAAGTGGNAAESLKEGFEGLDAKELDDILLKLQQIIKMKNEAGNAGKSGGKTGNGSGDWKTGTGGGSFLGLSGDQWEKFFSDGGMSVMERLQAGAEAVRSATQDAFNIASKFSERQTKLEQQQLKAYEKANEKKKKSLEKRLNSGLMTEGQYNAEVEKMDAEYQAYQEQIALRQAKREKAMNISQTIINTATGVMKTISQFGLPWGLVPAAAVTALGAAQVAAIAATPIVSGYEEGGYAVERRQDGKVYKARLSPDKRGFIGSPTILVSENGQEYVIPKEGLDNPTLMPLIATMETARKNGRLKSLDFRAVYPVMQGRESGGYASPAAVSPPSGTEATVSAASPSDSELKALLVKLSRQLDRPIEASVRMTGRNGLEDMMQRRQIQKKRGLL